MDDSPLITHWEPKSTSREITFQKDITDWQTIAKNLAAITKKVVNDLKYGGYKGRTITVKIKFSDFVIQTRAKSLTEQTDSLEIIRKIVHKREDYIREQGERSIGGLMGVVMKELGGKVDGKIAKEILTKEIHRLLET